MRKFYAMEEKGEISKKTLNKWKEHTPNIESLPEKKAMLNSFQKIGIYLKKLKPVPAAIVQQREAQMAMAEATKGKSPIADRVARRAKSI